MKRLPLLRPLLLLALLPGPFFGCDSTDPETAPTANPSSAVLLEIEQSWAAAIASGDIEHILRYWAEDAVNYSPGEPPAVGKAGIEAMVRRNREIPGFAFKTQPTQASISDGGSLGYTLGTFQLSFNDPTGNPITKGGNFINIWKVQPDGSWKCVITAGVPGPPAG